jgi:ABC-2 type transport system permease protein
MLPTWLIQLYAVALKEVRHIVRDRRMMGLLLIAPAIQLGLFGLAVDFDVDRVPTIVVDHDRTELSRQHLRQVLADGTLIRTEVAESDNDALKAIDSGEAAAALIVPAGFAADLARGATAHLQVLVDGTDPNRSSIAAATVARYARAQTKLSVQMTLENLRQTSRVGPVLDPNTVLAAIPTLPDVNLLPRVLNNPRLKTSTYMVPGIIALLLLIVTVIVMAMGLARERETGTLEQVMVTPMSSLVLMVGKLLPYVLIGLFDFVLALVVATYFFGVPLRGPLSVAVVGTTAYLICTLGIGLLISTISRTQQQAFIGGFLFLMPALLLSGVMTPLWGIPDWLMPVTRINPVRYYVEIVRGVLLRGSDFVDLSSQLSWLFGMGIGVLGFAAWRFQRSLG